ncbi:hypothetical protein DACRYDRAFT_115088 [Dacryopinax primogenitus]|uniref:DUF4210 domain-containing protein n=1 Tax=Dacryopinax primogenitus (strain DJM 731) TaxID=1858805 RepID=M5G6C5_DACPD|nr:uncharacterized protein DACRYDRAFT_115088 [Dacryopinax primogenitus]EJU03755.1 hypothetical protein DACRYDRAFT_115088 [Dacryopinax primogenitus]
MHAGISLFPLSLLEMCTIRPPTPLPSTPITISSSAPPAYRSPLSLTPTHAHPLPGSWSSSLLSLRIPAPHTLQPKFTARLRLPSKALTIPFNPTFYSLPIPTPTPYVALLPIPLPRLPLPPKGSLQLLLLNPELQPLRAFLVPYDVRHLPPGGRAIVRQTLYAEGVLKYAVQFGVTCDEEGEEMDMPELPSSPLSSSSASSSGASSPLPSPRHPKPHIHLQPNIRIVFSSRVEDSPLKIKNEQECSFPSFPSFPSPSSSPSVPLAPGLDPFIPPVAGIGAGPTVGREIGEPSTKSPSSEPPLPPSAPSPPSPSPLTPPKPRTRLPSTPRPSSPTTTTKFSLPLSPRLGPTLALSTENVQRESVSVGVGVGVGVHIPGEQFGPGRDERRGRTRGRGKGKGKARTRERGRGREEDVDPQLVDTSREETGPLIPISGKRLVQRQFMPHAQMQMQVQADMGMGMDMGWDGRPSRALGKWADEAVIR